MSKFIVLALDPALDDAFRENDWSPGETECIVEVGGELVVDEESADHQIAFLSEAYPDVTYRKVEV